MVASERFSCPGCERKNFRSLTAVRDHFLKKSHSLNCPMCQRVFKDELGVIQHYQKSKCASTNTSNITQQISSPTLPSNSIQINSPIVVKPFEHGMNIPDDHVPPIGLGESLGPEVLTGVKVKVPSFPTVLDHLEQSLILRYLRSRCHSWNRLRTEKYILGLGSTRNKQRPCKGSIQAREFRETPHLARQGGGACQAIAVDCEMVGVRDGRQSLAFLSAVDFLTGQMLISRYVVPSEEVFDWRSKFSGITKDIMSSAICSGATFSGWREARDKLWEFMDGSTILVGQSLNYDLEVLGICHAKIVDTAILTAETVFPSIISTKPLPRMWSLKSLAKDLLNLEIQNGNRGHSALEDAYAAREIAIWCIRNPEKLKMWAENTRHQEEECRLKKSLKVHRKGKSRSDVPASQPTRAWEYGAKHSDYSDDLRWSGFVEEFGWPEDYDPWSD